VLLCVASAVLLLPVVWSVSTSLKSAADVFLPGLGLIPWHPTLAAYRSVFGAVPFARFLVNSLVVTTAVVVLNVVFDSCAAYAFAKLRFPGREALFRLLLTAMLVPAQVGMLPLFLMLKRLGLVNTYGGVLVPWLASVFGIFLVRQVAQAIPDDLLNSARLDGAGEWRIYRSIVLPNLGPVLATLAVFVFMSSWNDFLWPLVILSDDRRYTLPVALASLVGEHVQDTELMMAGAVVTVLPVLALFVVLQRWYIRGVMAGSVKG